MATLDDAFFTNLANSTAERIRQTGAFADEADSRTEALVKDALRRVAVAAHDEKLAGDVRTLTAREWHFLQALSANALDQDTALVFADWLEENGRDEAGRRVRLLAPQPGNLLILWPTEGTPAAQEAARLALEDLRPFLPPGVTCVTMAAPDARIEDLTEEDMRDIGWVRAEHASAALLREQAETRRLRRLLENAERQLCEISRRAGQT